MANALAVCSLLCSQSRERVPSKAESPWQSPFFFACDLERHLLFEVSLSKRTPEMAQPQPLRGSGSPEQRSG